MIFEEYLKKDPLCMLKSDYIIGLVDGEGSFTFHLNTNPTRRNRIEPRFYLKLRAEDKELLDALRNFFKCGKVYIQRDQRPNHSLCYRFEVGNRLDLFNTIIPFFERHQLKSKSKRRDFKLFCHAMYLIADGAHLKKEGIEKLLLLKSKMH